MEGVQVTAAPGAVAAAVAAAPPVGQPGLYAQHAAQPAASAAPAADPAAANPPPLAAANALAAGGVGVGVSGNPAAAAAAAASAYGQQPPPLPGATVAIVPAVPAVAPVAGAPPPPQQPAQPQAPTAGLPDRLVPDEPYIINHDYVDYAAIPPSIVLKDYTEPTNTGGISQPFPQRLHALLSTPALYDSRVIGWQEHGRCFVIRQPKDFARTTMVTHFKHRQFTSFQRQLNLYGFKRLTRGPDKGAYYHGECELECGVFGVGKDVCLYVYIYR